MTDFSNPLFEAHRWLWPGEDPNHPKGRMPAPEILTEIIEGCLSHRPWFDDFTWRLPGDGVRNAVNAYIAEAFLGGKVWEVYRDRKICGIFLLNRVKAHIEAYPHFVFFDHELHNKRDLCRAGLRLAFQDEALDPHILRVELPYNRAAKLAGFLRKALGFKYEAERRLPNASQAKQYSRRHHATLYEGKWVDALLLSITKDEFLTHERSLSEEGGHQHSPISGTVRVNPVLPPADSIESPASIPAAISTEPA